MVQLQRLLIVVVLSLAMLVSGCASPAFVFPVQEGDVNAGRQAFVDHQCHQCHSVAGIRMPPLAGASGVLLELGGETAGVRTYGELMTSVINPNHAISDRYREQLSLEAAIPLESPMPMPRIDNMTVRQLIDLVAFLDSRYVLVEGYSADY
jgi:sulfur-oxidizing protein SoxX